MEIEQAGKRASADCKVVIASVPTLGRAGSARLAAAIRILDLSARWRNQPPSDAQRGLLRRKGIPIPKGLTRGQASWMIGLLSAHRQA